MNISLLNNLEIHSRFIGTKLKWDRRRIDDMILPVMKRINTKEVCLSIISFFNRYIHI
jgi:hypothetical protein